VGLFWLLVLSKRERTDDAYVNGNKVVIRRRFQERSSPCLRRHAARKSGQVLVRLDPVDAQTGLARSASALGQSVRQVRQQKLTADQYDSMIATRRLELARPRLISPSASRSSPTAHRTGGSRHARDGACCWLARR